jgi:hypothetical protein
MFEQQWSEAHAHFLRRQQQRQLSEHNQVMIVEVPDRQNQRADQVSPGQRETLKTCKL